MKTNNIALSVLFLMFLAVTSCGNRGGKLPPDITISLRTALNAGDAAAATKLFTDDGALLPGLSNPIKGKAAIKQYMERSLRGRLQFWINSEASSTSGNLAYDEGIYRIRDIRRSEDVDTGRYINIFKRVDGKWEIYRAIFSPNAVSRATDTLSLPE